MISMSGQKLKVFCEILKLLEDRSILNSDFVLNNKKSLHFEFLLMLSNRDELSFEFADISLKVNGYTVEKYLKQQRRFRGSYLNSLCRVGLVEIYEKRRLIFLKQNKWQLTNVLQASLSEEEKENIYYIVDNKKDELSEADQFLSDYYRYNLKESVDFSSDDDSYLGI